MNNPYREHSDMWRAYCFGYLDATNAATSRLIKALGRDLDRERMERTVNKAPRSKGRQKSA